MFTARTGNRYISSSARNAQTGFTKRTFEIFMLTVGKTGKEVRHRVATLLDDYPIFHKYRVFSAAFIMVSRKRAHRPKRKKHKLSEHKRKIDVTADEHRNEPENKRDRDNKYVQLVVAVTAVHKSTKQNISPKSMIFNCALIQNSKRTHTFRPS